MTTTYTTSPNGTRFYIEPVCDIDERTGKVFENETMGVYAGLVVGKDELSGIWFETRQAALEAINGYCS